MPNAFRNSIVLFLLCCFSLGAIAQHDFPTPEKIDSVSWNYYLSGDWDALIETGKLARKHHISFKWMEQRLGYAWYLKGDYYKSKIHYMNALQFDANDSITHLYLYYTNLATGHTANARYHASRLNPESLKNLKIQQWRLLNSIDAEYSMKRPDAYYRDNDLREDGFYRRIGLHSFPGFRLSVYQSLSGYQQTTEYENTTNQLEYSALLNYQLSSRLSMGAGYHFTGTRYTVLPDSFYLPGHQLSAFANYHWLHFDFSAGVSRYTNEFIRVDQAGLHWGTGFSLPIPIYLKSSVYWLNDHWTDATTLEPVYFEHLVFNQSAGAMIWKNRLWAEASVTLGNQNYFTAADGLYFYNSPDPVVFKTGLGLTAYLTRKLSSSIHYGIERKHWIINDEYYLQQAITGGIVWIL